MSVEEDSDDVSGAKSTMSDNTDEVTSGHTYHKAVDADETLKRMQSVMW